MAEVSLLSFGTISVKKEDFHLKLTLGLCREGMRTPISKIKALLPKVYNFSKNFLLLLLLFVF